MPEKEFICQREAEGRTKCNEECEHCSKYFEPLKDQIDKYEDDS